MRTVGWQLPESQKGGATVNCDICGVRWYRSQCVRKRNGLLYCPDDVAEVDPITLSEAHANEAARVRQAEREPAGPLETLDGSSLSSVHYKKASDWP